MADTRTLLALGAFSDEERRLLNGVATDSSFSVHCEREPRAASLWLDERDVDAILLDGDQPAIESFAIERRAESRHCSLPVMSWATTVGDLGFASAFAWGADDIVLRSTGDTLKSRLRRLTRSAASAPESTRGTALVADPDRTRRIVIGRILRNAGYSVTFAVQAEDIETFLSSQKVAVTVASSDLLPNARPLIERTRTNDTQPLWILTCPPRDIAERRSQLSDLERVTTTDGFAPAENVLFVANEMDRPRGVDNRAAQRLLYGTTVAFRGAGRDSDDYGYCYNVSEGGLYVRTLAPPDDDLAWLELRPPRCERRVRLVGRVAWRRGLERGEYATVPPGFGVQIQDGAQMDRELWVESCRTYAQSLS